MITIPEGIEKLSYGLFHGCRELKFVLLPKTLKVLEDYVFYKCSSLEAVTIPNGVVKIPSATFYNCTKLVYVKLPNDLKVIGSYAFNLCTKLRVIAIPRSVDSIGEYAFSECGLISVNLPESLKEIGIKAFEMCKNLRLFAIPDSVERIGRGIVDACINLDAIYCSEATLQQNRNEWIHQVRTDRNNLRVYKRRREFENSQVIEEVKELRQLAIDHMRTVISCPMWRAMNDPYFKIANIDSYNEILQTSGHEVSVNQVFINNLFFNLLLCYKRFSKESKRFPEEMMFHILTFMKWRDFAIARS